MQIKLIAIDMDDTLLNGELAISPRCREAITRASEQGITVAMASGRMARSITPYMEALNLNTPLIACNGATVYDKPGGAVIYSRPVALDLAIKFCAFAESNGWYVQAYVGDEYIFDCECGYSELYKSIARVAGRGVGKPLSEALCGSAPPHKLLVIDESARTPGILVTLKSHFGGSLELAISKPFYVEVTHPEANKGAALNAVLGHYGIAPGNAMAIGDSLNDVPMFKAAGLSVAMGNASDDVKRAASRVTSTNEDDGVAAAIEAYALASSSTVVN